MDCKLYQPQSSAINLKELQENEKTPATAITPRPLIKSVSVQAKIDSDQTVYYLMQKYPQLDSLTINQFKQEDYREDSDDDDDDYNWNMEPRLDKNFCVAFSRCKAEISTAVSNQFVSYLCNISTYNVNHIYVPVTNIPDTFNTYCNLSPNTSKMLEIKY